MTARDDWLAKRKLGIGSSDAAAVVGLSPWATPLDVYLDKRGEAPDKAENEAMRWGKLLEAPILEAYEQDRGVRVTARQELLTHPAMPFMLATIDGRTADRLIEAKTARSDHDWGEAGTDQVPSYYVPQIQHSLAIVGLPVCDVPVLIAGSDFRIYTVPRDDELIGLLVEEERKLWQRILDGDAPDPTTPEEVRLRFRQDSGSTIVASPATYAACVELRRLRDEITEREKLADQAQARIQLAMGEAAMLTYEGRVLATWRTSKPVTRFDALALKKDAPELWASYAKAGDPQRRFLLKE